MTLRCQVCASENMVARDNMVYKVGSKTGSKRLYLYDCKDCYAPNYFEYPTIEDFRLMKLAIEEFKNHMKLNDRYIYCEFIDWIKTCKGGRKFLEFFSDDENLNFFVNYVYQNEGFSGKSNLGCDEHLREELLKIKKKQR